MLLQIKMENNTNLVLFLRNTADSLENNKLSPQQELQIGEFFMSYHFQENNKELDSNELKKFIFMGWYIYCVILKNKNLTN